MKRGFYKVVVLACITLSFIGCSQNKKLSGYDLVMEGLSQLKEHKTGELIATYTDTPTNKNLEGFEDNIEGKITLSYQKEKTTIFFEYSNIEKYKDQLSETKIKSTEEGMFISTEDENWIDYGDYTGQKSNKDNAEEFLNNIIQMIEINYDETQIEKMEIIGEEDNTVCKLIVSKDALPENRMELTYTYWLDQNTDIRKVKINQVDIMTEGGDTDVITTEFYFEMMD